MNDLEFGKLTKFCFPGFGQKQGFFRKDSSLLLLNFSLQMSKIQDTNWDGPIRDENSVQTRWVRYICIPICYILCIEIRKIVLTFANTFSYRNLTNVTCAECFTY